MTNTNLILGVLTPIFYGVALNGMSSYALAQQPSPPASVSLDEIVVTGSYIPRTNTETASAVQVLTAEQLKQSGYTDVSDILLNLSANGVGSRNQAFQRGFATGASGVSLRGLSVGDTLVLIDGHRTVAYPLTDDAERNFVDISAVPFNAIDRIEVLKDGASAVYGSDAIGGVINIILKKSFTGTEFTAEEGTSERGDGTLTHLAVITGSGDLESDGYNGYLVVDFHHQDSILASNRHAQFTNLDWSSYPGGINTTPGAANNPYTYFPPSITGYLVNPFTASGTPFAYLPGCNATAAAANACTYTLAGQQIQPPTEQINVVGKVTKTLFNNWEGSVQATFFSSRAQTVANNYPPFDFDTFGFFAIAYSPTNPVPRVVPNPPAILTVPANYPGNPFGVAAPLIYNFHELGQPQQDTLTNTYRLLGQLGGIVAGWKVDGAIGVMYSHMTETYYGNLEYGPLQNALNNGYQVGLNPSPNGAALFAPPMVETPSSSLSFIDVHATRQVMQLPGGPLSLAIGVQDFHSADNQTAAATSESGVQTELAGPHFVVGSQNNLATFAELNAEVIQHLEVNAAGRYDHYDTYGSSMTPKVGVKFQPIPQLALRGTWGKGFRAPSIAESGKSATFFPYGYYTDPVLCPNPNGANGSNSPGNYPQQCNTFLLSYEPSNSHLKAVESTQYTFGIIVEPLKAFNLSVDYYNIKLANDIITALEPTAYIRAAPSPLQYVNAAGQLVTQTPPVGPLLYADYPYVNAQATQVSGFDVDLRSYLDVDGAGRLSASVSYTHEISYTESFGGVTYQLAGTHGPGISGNSGNPKDRAVVTLGWDRGPIDVTTTINFTGSFNITDPTSGYYTCLDTLNNSFSSAYNVRFAATVVPNASFCNVHSFIDVDLFGRYKSGTHLSLHASILNLFNRPPPLDLETIGGGGQLAYDAPLNQIGAIGRFFTVGATYTF